MKTIRILLTFLLTFSICLSAQYDQLAANQNGSVVAFLDRSNNSLIRVQSNGAAIVVARPAPPRLAGRPAFAGNGSIVYSDCNLPCVDTPRTFLWDAVGGATPLGVGEPTASPNGRLVYLQREERGLLPISAVRVSQLLDLGGTSPRVVCESTVGDCLGKGMLAGALADNGSTLVLNTTRGAAGTTEYLLARYAVDGTETLPIRLTAAPGSASISADGTKAVYATTEASRSRLWLADLGTGAVRAVTANEVAPVGYAVGEPNQKARILPDGSSVVAAVDAVPLPGGHGPAQSVLFQTNLNVPAVALAQEPGSINEIALSGDGKFVFYSTAAGALRRVNRITGEVTTWMERFFVEPGLTDFAGSPGSLMQIIGTGFTERVDVRVAGFSINCPSKSPARLLCYLPQRAPGQVQISIAQEGSAINFEGTFRLTATPTPKAFAAQSFWIAAQGVGATPVNSSTPVRSGDLVRMYMRDLGPVQAGPFPNRLVAPFSCQFDDPALAPPAVQYVGSVGGFEGLYQLNLYMPVFGRAGTRTLSCGGTNSEAGALLPVAP